MTKTLKTRLIAPFVEPYSRYQYADILHAFRLGTAVIVSLIVNHFSQFPHGEWTTITIFIILGLLQYQGAIYTKAKERILGTLLGIGVGLSLLWLGHHLLTGIWLYFLLIGIISGIIGYYAVKQLGYIGLLTGITMCMIISSTSDVASDGMYRALNVLIGTLIAVAATFVVPLKSTLMWRFLLAKNLDACADMYDGVEAHISDPNIVPTHQDTSNIRAVKDSGGSSNASQPIESVSGSNFEQQNLVNTEQMVQAHIDLGATTATSLDGMADQTEASFVDTDMVQQFKKINQRLLRVRGHIAATASESGIDTPTLDMIQRTHRNIIGTIDLLLSAAPHLAYIPIDSENRVLLDHYHHELTQAMRHMAAVLRSPSDEVFRPITRIPVSTYPSVRHLEFEWKGYFWLTQTLQSQLQSLSDLLQHSKDKWFAASGLRYQRQEQRRIHAHGGESDLDV